MSTIFGTIINVNMVENYLVGLNLSGSWKNSFLETLVEIYKESQKFGINPVIPKFERNFQGYSNYVELRKTAENYVRIHLGTHSLRR